MVGDALLDRDVGGVVDRLAPDAPVPVLDQRHERERPGGAALAAALLALGGRPVALITAVGDDAAGRRLASLVSACGVDVVDLGLAGPTPEKVRLCADGRPLLRLDRGGPRSAIGPAGDAARHALRGSAVLVADYGRGVAADPQLRAWLPVGRTPLVWDPHPRGPVAVAGATLVTPNRAELIGCTAGSSPPATADSSLADMVSRARRLLQAWDVRGVAVTLGGEGAVLVEGDGAPLVVPTEPVAAADCCGAGDRFAATVAGALADGAVSSEAVVEGVRAAAAFVAGGGARSFPAAGPGPSIVVDGFPAGPPSAAGERPADADPVATARAVRRAGGTVVAAGGCFDLLHAGHVAMLQAARRLGSHLVVCLNGDASVRRLKGAGRPLQRAADRAAVLQALDCVDGVVVFDEDSPARALAALRPHVFAKGGDYAGSRLPEADLLESWGGHVVVLPYLGGRSTTGIVARAGALWP